MSLRARSLSGVAVLSTAGAVALTSTTYAAAPRPLPLDDVQTVTVGASSPKLLSLSADQLSPGSSTHARFLIRRGSGLSGGTFAVSVEDVRDLERGCLRPEVRAGDTSCGKAEDQGELSGQLLVGLSWSSASSSCRDVVPPTTGRSMASLEGVALRPPAGLPDEDEVCVVVGLVLPFAADNLVQSDLVTFDLRLGLQDVALVTPLPEQPVVEPDLLQPGPDDPDAPVGPGSPISGAGPPQAAEGSAEAPEQPAGPVGVEQLTGQPGRQAEHAAARMLMQEGIPRQLPLTGGPLLALLLAGGGVLAAGAALARCGRTRRQ